MARVLLTGLVIAVAAMTWEVREHDQGVGSDISDAEYTSHHFVLEDHALPPWARGEGLATVDEGTGPLVAILPTSIEAIICGAPWPCQEALAVAWCESRLDSQATGMYGERGLFQVHPAFWGPVPEDPVGQVAQAFAIWQQHGWEVWTCRP